MFERIDPQAGTALPIEHALSQLDRAQLAALVEAAIGIMDVVDGDTDLETTGTEDDFTRHASDGPGCPIADADMGADDYLDDRSYAEWHTLPSNLRRYGHIDGKPIDPLRPFIEEDDEDDDPDTSAEDDPLGFDPEEDRCSAGDDVISSGSVNCGGAVCEETGPGDPDDVEDDEPEARRPHLRRIQRTRCVARRYRDPFTRRDELLGYALAIEPVAPDRRSLLKARHPHARSRRRARR